jgi:uncharacterized membrane protein
MDFSELLIGLLLLACFLLIPVLAISAFVRVRRLERRSVPPPSPPNPPTGEDNRISALERRLAEVEHKLTALATAPPAPQPETTAAPRHAETAPPAPQPPRPAAASEPPPTAGGLDLETLIAGRWLNRVGIAALLFASGFFVKYAFDNNWVGPSGRVIVLLVLGTALVAWSQWLLGRGYFYFSEGIAGLGAGVLYLALWAGWSYFKLMPQGVAFAGMMGVTAAMAVIALGRDSQRVALVALLGGFLTPALVSTGTDQQVILFTYLLVLNAGLLFLARPYVRPAGGVREWKSLEWLGLLATVGYFALWYARFYEDPKLLRTALFATLFFALFGALPVRRALARGTLPARQTLLVLANAFWYLLALRALLWPGHRWALMLMMLALAAAHQVVAQQVPPAEEKKGEGPSPVRVLFTGLALTFATLAIPVRLDGKWITIAWAVEGAVLVWSGFATRVRLLRGVGLFLFAVTALRLVAVAIPAERFLLNPRFATFLVAVVCFAAGLHFARSHQGELGGDEDNFFSVVGVAVNVFLLWALSAEVYDLFERRQALGGVEAELAQQLALSLLWILYATVLTIVGFRTAQAGLRWQGLLLFGLVVGKAFLYDLSFLERVYRIVSFVALGVVLLVVSFLYQKRLLARRAAEKETQLDSG